MRCPRALALSLLLLPALPIPASATPAGTCLPVPVERCERWTATYDDPTIESPYRSDQFAQDVLVNTTTVFVVVKNVSLLPSDFSKSPGAAVVVAYDRVTGAVRWTLQRRERTYLSPHHAALSPDGSRLYLTGAAYNGYPVGATDSRISTRAFDAATGRELWAASWDGRPDGTDNPKGIVVAPDGKEVYVTGVTTTKDGDLDYVTIGYRADGRQLWAEKYAGPKKKGMDAPFGIAVTPDGRTLVVTGWSDGVVEYDADYGTVAYSLVRGRSARLAWVARYDGIGAHKSDRAMAVAADGDRIYVTGDSWAGTTGSGYDYATVAYDVRRGQQVWQGRWSGGRGGFNSPVSVVAAAGRVLVSGQASAASADDANDTGTVAYDAATGHSVWSATFGPPHHDDFGRGLALSPDGATAYVVSRDVPIVQYTALARLSVVAYDTATGTSRWQRTIDASPGDALAGAAIAANGTTVAVVGNITRSANPAGAENQNVYDVLTAVFAP
ncbi:MAG: hypothetical protein QOE45_3415 [Frankiaceae bacterium]|jgi:hypothetical protein|nr:hypothetical protein [Frankiaceae bacterium]